MITLNGYIWTYLYANTLQDESNKGGKIMLIPLVNKKGHSLPAVIIITAILFILLAAAIQISAAENIFTGKNEDKVKAYYIARSGAHSIAEYMLNDPGNASDLIGKTSDVNTQVGGGSFTVSVEEDVSNNVIIITSVGEFNGVQQTAKVKVARTGSGVGGIFNHAIVAKENVSVVNTSGQGIEITGSVASQSGTISLGTHGYASGGVLIDENIIFPPIVEPPDRDPAISYDHVYSVITTNLTITSDENNPKYVYATGVTLQNETVTISGNGVVHLFVDGDIDMGTNSRFNAPTGKLYIYVIGNRTVKLWGAGSQNNVYIYAPDSDISWNNAQPNNYLFGGLIGKTITLHNQLKIEHNPEMVNQIDLDSGAIGVTYTGYTWID